MCRCYPEVKKEAQSFAYRNLDDAGFIKLRGLLNNVNCILLKRKKINDAFNNQIHIPGIIIFQDYIEILAREKYVVIPFHKIMREPWLTKCLLESGKNLDKLYKKNLKQPQEHPSHKHKEYRNLYNTLKRTANEDH